MIKLRYLALLTLFVPTNVFGQDGLFKENWYVELTGTQGDEDVSLDLILTDDGRIIGKSCPSIHDNLVSYSGKLNNQNLSLNVLSEDTFVGHYSLSPNIQGGYSGQYKSETTGETQRVDLQYSSGFYGTPDKRYLDFPGSDIDLEIFTRDVIESFLSGNKQWLSENIALPFLAYIEEEKTLEINAPSEFIQNYESIATKTLLNKLSSSPTCNLWANHSGVMLGKGEVWIWKGESSTNENPVFVIKNVTSY